MDDRAYMRQALALARKGLGRTAPNPPVGAVLVKGGRVIGEGFHPQAGKPHAEVCALDACMEDPAGATLYVTLEPCCHFGKTPPCTEAIVITGIKRVVIGALDPNPIMAGKGVQCLKKAGIEVVSGIEEDMARELITWYAHWMEKGRPYVIVKAAMTLDGRIAAASGESKWISSEESRKRVHELRNEVDAVLVGIGTVLKDNPRLTCRIPGGRDPYRVILDPDLIIPAHAQCLGEKCIIITADDQGKRPIIGETGTRVVRLVPNGQGLFAWPEIWKYLGELGLHAVMVEGGGGIYASLLQSGAFEHLLIFLAPKILGGGIPFLDWDAPEKIDQAVLLVVTKAEMIGGDVLVEARRRG